MFLASLFGKSTLDLDDALAKANPNNKARLRDNVEKVLKDRKNLKPQFDATPIDGSKEGLFRLVGTLPSVVHGSPCEFPISIYFDSDYPHQAPRCFITPGQNWDAFTHEILGPDRKIHLEYLSRWSADKSTLTDLIEALSDLDRSALEAHQAAQDPVQCENVGKSESDGMRRVLIWIADVVSTPSAALDGIDVWYPSKDSASIHREALGHILRVLLKERDTKKVFSVFLDNPSRYPHIVEDIRKLFEVRGLAIPKFVTCEQSEKGKQDMTIAKDAMQALQIVREASGLQHRWDSH